MDKQQEIIARIQTLTTFVLIGIWLVLAIFLGIISILMDIREVVETLAK